MKITDKIFELQNEINNVNFKKAPKHIQQKKIDQLAYIKNQVLCITDDNKNKLKLFDIYIENNCYIFLLGKIVHEKINYVDAIIIEYKSLMEDLIHENRISKTIQQTYSTQWFDEIYAPIK